MESNNELDNFKKLLDIGAITESEFNQLTNKLRIEALPPSEVVDDKVEQKNSTSNIQPSSIAPTSENWFQRLNGKQIATLFVSIFFLSLIIISSVGGFNKSNTSGSSSSSNDTQLTAEEIKAKEMRESLGSRTYYCKRIGSISFEPDENSGSWMGVMILSINQCYFTYGYYIKGRNLDLTLSNSNCNSDSNVSVQGYINNDNSFRLTIKGTDYRFIPN